MPLKVLQGGLRPLEQPLKGDALLVAPPGWGKLTQILGEDDRGLLQIIP